MDEEFVVKIVGVGDAKFNLKKDFGDLHTQVLLLQAAVTALREFCIDNLAATGKSREELSKELNELQNIKIGNKIASALNFINKYPR